ncbi:MAG: hypothetical protein PHU21_11065 [Elusimicrobia bacterium]|nr:hypothetical protein [Elusimicrobiota bacterium]
MLEKLKAFNRRVAAAVQAVLLPAGLFSAYYLGLGLTWIMVRLLKPSVLRGPRPPDGTFWREARDYEPDEADCLRQS